MNQAGNDFVQILIAVAATMALYLLVQIIIRINRYAFAWLEKKEGEAKAAGETARAASFNFAMTVLNAVTNTVVSSIEANKAFRIRQAVKAGEAKFEELTSLSTEAYYEIIGLLGGQTKAVLDGCVDDSEKFIREKIEELLPKVKADYLKTVPEKLTTDGVQNAEQAED